MNAVDIPWFKPVRCISFLIKRKMLVIDIRAGVVEVGVVIGLVSATFRLIVRALISIVGSCLDEPIRDHALLFALNYLATVRHESFSARLRVPCFRFLLGANSG